MIEAENAYYYEKLIEKGKLDSTVFKVKSQSIKNKLLRSKQSMVFNNWYDLLKKNSDIVDNRKMFGL